jgi:hypothetical protein
MRSRVISKITGNAYGKSQTASGSPGPISTPFCTLLFEAILDWSREFMSNGPKDAKEGEIEHTYCRMGERNN